MRFRFTNEHSSLGPDQRDKLHDISWPLRETLTSDPPHYLSIHRLLSHTLQCHLRDAYVCYGHMFCVKHTGNCHHSLRYFTTSVRISRIPGGPEEVEGLGEYVIVDHTSVGGEHTHQ